MCMVCRCVRYACKRTIHRQRTAKCFSFYSVGTVTLHMLPALGPWMRLSDARLTLGATSVPQGSSDSCRPQFSLTPVEKRAALWRSRANAAPRELNPG